MPKIQRETQKIFCNSAESDQLAVFGSMATGTPVYSNNIEDLQNNEAFDLGWDAATLEDKAPFMEEMNGMQYGITKQLAYNFQEGIPEYDAGTTYYIGSICKVLEEGKPVLYTSLTDENLGNNPVTDATNWERLSFGGGGLEIGDIGFTQMSIDETKGLRRKLNGQLIIQDQYAQLTNIIKNSVALNPSLACTEAEWQTEVAMNTFGLCGRFVIDDEGGTIRLPKYPNYFIAGLANIAPVVGNGKVLGLTNGSSTYGLGLRGQDWNGARGSTISGVTAGDAISTTSAPNNASITGYVGVSTVASNSGIEAQINEKQIAGTYFIQVATGAEIEDNIINEIELNNPFSLLDYKFSEYELNNISWLRSNGQYNPKAIYPAVYDLLLKIYNGVETKAGVSVKLTQQKIYAYTFDSAYTVWFETQNPVVGQDVYGYNPFRIAGTVINVSGGSVTIHDTVQNIDRVVTRNSANDRTESIYTDEDFVINQADETFRLPIKVKLASGKAVVGNGMALGLTNGTVNTGLKTNSSTFSSILSQTVSAYGQDVGTSNSDSGYTSADTVYGVTTDPTKSGIETSDSDLYLYFYVGETVQNANLINAGRIEEKLGDCLTRNNKQEIISWGIPDYSAGVDIKTTLQNNKSYTAPTKGVLFNSMIPTNKTEIKINGYSVGIRQYSTYGNYIPTPYYLNAGDVFSVTSWADSNGSAYFFPLKGAN